MDHVDGSRDLTNGGTSIEAILAELNRPDRTFEPLSWETLEHADAAAGGVQWTIDRLIERGTMNVLFGPPGAAKSYVAIDMSLCMATGERFAGRDVASGLVVSGGGEGKRAFGRRLRAWRAGRELDERVVNDRFVYFGDRVGLLQSANVHNLAEAIAELADERQHKVEMITFDTWARHLEGDENATADVQKGCTNIFALLRDRFDCTVNLIHHTGWTDPTRMRGARALEAECDGVYAVNLDGERNVTTVTANYMRDGDKPDPLTFRGKQMDLGDVSAWALEYDAELRPTPKVQFELGPKEMQVLHAIRALHQMERERLSANGVDPVAAEVTPDMLKTRLSAMHQFDGSEAARRSLYNVVARLRDKRLISKRGKANMVPMGEG